MPRYFVELAYDGSNYSGWQRQQNAISVQEVIEEKFSQVLQEDIKIVGCGRTDAGVHARQYFMHFDSSENLTEQEHYGLKSVQPKDIAIYDIKLVQNEAHARFDALLREYKYHISIIPSPFNRKYTWATPRARSLDLEKLNIAAKLIGSYKAFYPFCKANSDVETYDCQIKEIGWVVDGEELLFTVSANRFLRGMVRMLVGACINISEDKLSIEDLKQAMENQTRLETSYSVPAQGLFLNRISYPYIS